MRPVVFAALLSVSFVVSLVGLVLIVAIPSDDLPAATNSAGLAESLRVGSRVLVPDGGPFATVLIAGEIEEIVSTNIDRRQYRGPQDALARLTLEDGRERWIRLGNVEAAVSHANKHPRVPVIPVPGRGRGDLEPDVGARGAK